MAVTKLENLIDPEVMAPMISAKLQKAIVATPFATIDTTLEGRAGSTITIPKYEYIGDAEEVAEGVAQGDAQLTTTTDTATVKKIVKDVTLTDEAVLSGYGNPVGEATYQLGLSLGSKVDNDVMDALKGAQVKYVGADTGISYDEVVNALDLFNEEENVEKVMFIHPHQVSELRKDANFISNDKYNNNVMMTGEIGRIGNARIVPSRKAVDDNGEYYLNPIVQLRTETQTGDESSAVTIFLKRDVNVETDRIVKGKKTLISADEHYAVALTNEAKVVVAKFPVTGTPSL